MKTQTITELTTPATPTSAEVLEAALSVLDSISDVVAVGNSNRKELRHLKRWCDELSDFARINPLHEHSSEIAIYGFLDLMAESLSNVASEERRHLLEMPF